ncbi:MAG: ankyrin repeat domain-containing protein [Sedimentisphaerales bacterium]|nr:ankyrin repeat domain-containing protein [Sedimentisphaerales bacterium]
MTEKNPNKNVIGLIILACLAGFIIIAYLGYEIWSNQDPCLEGLIWSENIPAITSILQKNSDLVNKICRHGRAPLHSAAFAGNADIIKLLLEKGADINGRDDNNLTPLYYARDPNTIEFLIKNGAVVNTCDGTGYTPLHHAAGKGEKALVDVLLKNGADATIENNAGARPADLAATSGYFDIADFIREEIQGDLNNNFPQ